MYQILVDRGDAAAPAASRATGRSSIQDTGQPRSVLYNYRTVVQAPASRSGAYRHICLAFHRSPFPEIGLSLRDVRKLKLCLCERPPGLEKKEEKALSIEAMVDDYLYTSNSFPVFEFTVTKREVRAHGITKPTFIMDVTWPRLAQFYLPNSL